MEKCACVCVRVHDCSHPWELGHGSAGSKGIPKGK